MIRTPSRSKDDHNVADQPGRLVVFVGLVIALFVGLTIRGLIHPEKVRREVESAASKIHPDVHVHFDSAVVSLADGFLPDFSVIIDGVRMDSDNPCWMTPRLSVDHLRLPLSLPALLQGRSPFVRVEAGDVEFRLLTERPASCEVSESAPAQAAPAQPKPVVSMVRKAGTQGLESSHPASGELESLEIDRLVIVSDANPWKGTLDLNDIEFTVHSAHPRVLELRARTHLLKDANGEFLTTPQIEVEYKEFPDKSVTARISGNIREGSYNITASYDPDSEEIKTAAEVRHLPLGQTIASLKQVHWIETTFEPHQSWISFRADDSGPVRKLKQQPFLVHDFHVEGDLGDMRAPLIEFHSLDPVVFNPFRIEIASLDLDRVLQFANQTQLSPIFNHIGQFHGVADIEDGDNFQLIGEQSGVEFIFANKGRRELQGISGIESELRRKKGLWNLRTGQAHFDQGEFRGEVKLNADSAFKNVDASLRIDELTLRPAVQQLMTQGGSIGSLQGQLQAHWNDGQLTKLKGGVKMPLLAIEGASLEKLLLSFDESAGQILFSPKIDKLTMSTNSPAFAVMQPVVDRAWVRENAFTMLNIGGLFRVKGFQDVQWSKLTARTDRSEALLTSEGGWNPAGQIDGKVFVRGSDQTHVFQIGGTRDHPDVSEATK